MHPLVFVTWVIPVSVTFTPLSVNSLGYSVCLSPANSLHTDQVGMQNFREEEGWWERERGRKGDGGGGEVVVQSELVG